MTRKVNSLMGVSKLVFLSLLSFLGPLSQSCFAQQEVVEIDETILELSFPYKKLGHEFNLGHDEYLVQAKAQGQHIFNGPKPKRDFAENRICSANFFGIIKTQKTTLNHFSLYSLGPDSDLTLINDTNLAYLRNFMNQVQYDSLPCGKSIFRLNSYLHRTMRVRAMRLEAFMRQMALQELFTSRDNRFVYPQFEMSEEEKKMFYRLTTNKIYQNIFQRQADSYESELAHLYFEQNQSNENWAYDYQVELATKTEEELFDDSKRDLENLIRLQDEFIAEIDDFWSSRCESASYLYRIHESKRCEDLNILDFYSGPTTNISEVMAAFEIKSYSDIKRNCRSERLLGKTFYKHTKGEKCQIVVNKGHLGDEAKLELQKILERNSFLKEQFQSIYNERIVGFYTHLIKNLAPDSELVQKFNQNLSLLEDITTDGEMYEHELFYQGSMEYDIPEIEIELPSKMPLDLPGFNPGWTDPVRPRF